MNVERLTFNDERLKFISHGGRKERKVITLLLTLALEGSQLTRDGERRGGCEVVNVNVYR